MDASGFFLDLTVSYVNPCTYGYLSLSSKVLLAAPLGGDNVNFCSVSALDSWGGWGGVIISTPGFLPQSLYEMLVGLFA